MKNIALVCLLAAAGCATPDQSLKNGSYLRGLMAQNKPQWCAAHGPLDTDEAVVRVYHDIQAGDKPSVAINKECQ